MLLAYRYLNCAYPYRLGYTQGCAVHRKQRKQDDEQGRLTYQPRFGTGLETA